MELATDTRDQAYEQVLPKVATSQSEILRVLGMEYNGPLSNSEIAEQLQWPVNRVTPRVFELRTMGLVKDAGKRKCRITNLTVHTWTLISKEGQ